MLKPVTRSGQPCTTIMIGCTRGLHIATVLATVLVMTSRRGVQGGSVGPEGVTLSGENWTLLLRLGEGGGEWHELHVEGLSAPVYLQFGLSEDGRLACTGILMGPRLRPGVAEVRGMPALLIGESGDTEITARDIRRIPLGAVLASVGDQARNPSSPFYGLLPLLPQWAAPLTDIKERLVKLRPGPTGHSEEHFRDVANRYRAALRHSPRRPVRALSEELHASEATIRRWLQRARDKGFLGQASPGKSGERKANGRTG